MAHSSALLRFDDEYKLRPDAPLQRQVHVEVAPQLVDQLALDDGGELWACAAPARVVLYPP
jgi:sugar lactone lactonase YvrE